MLAIRTTIAILMAVLAMAPAHAEMSWTGNDILRSLHYEEN